jgi:hypothetical protein
MRLRLSCLFGSAIALGAANVAAQQSTPAPPVPAPPPPATHSSGAATPAPSVAPAAAAPACFPSCREGFTCHEGRCVSLCNPPCPEGLECVAGARCEPPLPGAQRSSRVYEPPAPPVKSFEARSHTLLAFHLGLPGTMDQDGVERELGTTYGFNIRGDAPVAGYVLLGPMLQLGAWSPDTTPETGNNYYVDLDLVIRLRVPITTSTFNYQLWVGMPIGLTLDVLGDDVPNVAGMGVGWNIGVLFGGAVHFTPKFGLFSEAGYLQHKLSHAAELGPDLDFALRQWCLNLGIVVKN